MVDDDTDSEPATGLPAGWSVSEDDTGWWLAYRDGEYLNRFATRQDAIEWVIRRQR